MPEYEHNREERLDAVIKDFLSSKEHAIKWMQDAGLIDTDNRLTQMYR